jgi:hypothetical protein
VTTQGLEKWLKAAADQAAQDWTVNFHLADARGTLDLLDGRGADKTDLYPLYRLLLRHGPQPRDLTERRNPWNA